MPPRTPVRVNERGGEGGRGTVLGFGNDPSAGSPTEQLCVSVHRSVLHKSAHPVVSGAPTQLSGSAFPPRLPHVLHRFRGGRTDS
jgi:hypothetical protein